MKISHTHKHTTHSTDCMLPSVTSTANLQLRTLFTRAVLTYMHAVIPSRFRSHDPLSLRLRTAGGDMPQPSRRVPDYTDKDAQVYANCFQARLLTTTPSGRRVQDIALQPDRDPEGPIRPHRSGLWPDLQRQRGPA